jgi:hypothetical protein
MGFGICDMSSTQPLLHLGDHLRLDVDNGQMAFGANPPRRIKGKSTGPWAEFEHLISGADAKPV